MPPSSVRVISVIGAGAWGTALAHLLATKGLTIRLWAYEPEVVESIQTRRENSWYSAGCRPSQLYSSNEQPVGLPAWNRSHRVSGPISYDEEHDGTDSSPFEKATTDHHRNQRH